MKVSRKIIIGESLESLNHLLFQKWLNLAQTRIRDNKQFTCVFSGGSTPHKFYQRLSSCKDDRLWRKVHIYLVDERFVDFKHEQSNYRMIRETLLMHINIPKENIHPIQTDTKTVELAAKRYEEDITKSFRLAINQIPEFDFVLLGMGEDGHTASLFPGDPAVDQKESLVTSVLKSQKGTQRVTLTLPVLNEAREVVVLAVGKNKAPKIKEILADDVNLPVGLVNPVKGKLSFFIDQDAADLVAPANP